jgi:hypothetical protein
MLYVFFKVKIDITITLTEKYEDTREIIRSRKCPKEKGQTMIYKTLHRKLTIEEHEPKLLSKSCNKS